MQIFRWLLVCAWLTAAATAVAAATDIDADVPSSTSAEEQPWNDDADDETVTQLTPPEGDDASNDADTDADTDADVQFNNREAEEPDWWNDVEEKAAADDSTWLDATDKDAGSPLLGLTLTEEAADVEETTDAGHIDSATTKEGPTKSRTLRLQEHFYRKFQDRYKTVTSAATSLLLHRPYALVQKVSPWSRGWNFIKDPLHAFPSAADIKIHNIFQRLAVFEINNADQIRRLLVGLRVISIAQALGVAIALAVVLGGALLVAPLAAFGRRSYEAVDDAQDRFFDVDDIYTDTHLWDQARQAQRVLSAIQSAQLAYQ